jgi:hypothetical protein
MQLVGLVVNLGTALADFNGLAAMALVRRHELDAAVTVPVIAPVDERHHPSAGLAFAAKRPAGVVASVLECSEQRFRVRVAV